jgi:hypothetical protein
MNYLILTDIDSNVYNFPDTFWIDSDPVRVQKKIANHAYAPGGKNTGDGFPIARPITISGTLQGDTTAAFEAKKRAFVQACLKGGYLTKYTDEVSRRIEIYYPQFDWGEEQAQKMQQVDVTFVAINTFWEDSSLTTTTDVVAGNDTLTIANSGGDYEVKPLIQIDADQGANVPAILFRNDSYGGIEFEYNNSSFVIGETVQIDCATGIITRNGGEEPDFFDGAFLRLITGNNTIQYEGNACTIYFKFRKVYM